MSSRRSRKNKTDNRVQQTNSYFYAKGSPVSAKVGRAKFLQAVASELDWLLPEIEDLSWEHREACKLIQEMSAAGEHPVRPLVILIDLLDQKRLDSEKDAELLLEMVVALEDLLSRIRCRAKWIVDEILDYFLICSNSPDLIRRGDEGELIIRMFWAPEGMPPERPFLGEVHRFVWNTAIQGYMQGDVDEEDDLIPPPYRGEVICLKPAELDGFALGLTRLFEFRSIGADYLRSFETIPQMKERMRSQFEISLRAYFDRMRSDLKEGGYMEKSTSKVEGMYTTAVRFYMLGETLEHLAATKNADVRTIERHLAEVRDQVAFEFSSVKRSRSEK